MILFNPSNVYALLYGAPDYGYINISPYLAYRIRAYVRLLILICFLITHSYFIPYSIYGRFTFFSIWLFLSVIFCLRSLISSQSVMNGVLTIMSRPKISWPDVGCNIVWYALHIAKYVTANIPNQGSSLSRYLFCTSTVRTRFAMNW